MRMCELLLTAGPVVKTAFTGALLMETAPWSFQKVAEAVVPSLPNAPLSG
jgi:hypothetical protein